jgi:plastocyanin
VALATGEGLFSRREVARRVSVMIDAPITIKPFSLRILVCCGLIIFFLGFFSSRYGVDFTGVSASPANAPADAKPASAAVAAPDTGAPAIVHVVMRNMKFDPPAVELKSGGVVEWKNEDITPHTATSTSFDSTSIDPDKTWRHTFSEPGSFPYSCTFHPDMKAVVTVK